MADRVFSFFQQIIELRGNFLTTALHTKIANHTNIIWLNGIKKIHLSIKQESAPIVPENS